MQACNYCLQACKLHKACISLQLHSTAVCNLCMSQRYFPWRCYAHVSQPNVYAHSTVHTYCLLQSTAMRVYVSQVWRPPQELIDSYSSGIEAVLGYKFQKRALLQEALTHTSWPDATQQVRGCSSCQACHFCTYFDNNIKKSKHASVVSSSTQTLAKPVTNQRCAVCSMLQNHAL